MISKAPGGLFYYAIPELSSPTESSAQIIHNPALKKMCFVQIILKKSNNLLTKDT